MNLALRIVSERHKHCRQTGAEITRSMADYNIGPSDLAERLTAAFPDCPTRPERVRRALNRLREGCPVDPRFVVALKEACRP